MRGVITELTTKAVSDVPSVWLRNGSHGGAMVFDRVDGRRVLFSVERHDDGIWKHVSVSRLDRLPSWDELREVKNVFLGEETVAVQILPRESDYVNQHPYCLHLWQYTNGPLWPIESRKK